MAAKKKKMMNETSIRSTSGDEQRHDHDVDHGQRQEDFPAELHQQVVFEPRDRPAHPDEDEEQQR